jgi:SAM-dependent methyltransferase
VASEHWSRVSRLWSLIGPPLRPSPEDVAVAESIARAWRDAHPTGPLDALILGVTPELATVGWPLGTKLVAIDASEVMVGAIWPSEGAPPDSRARVGDWRELEMPDASVDVAAGDGSLTVLEHPADYRTVLRELRRVLRPDARLVLRVYARPEVREEVTEVADALWSGRVGSVSALKWRLAMAVQKPDERNVAVSDVWQAFCAICPDRSRLLEQLDWSPESLATIDPYRESAARYSFPTLAEVRSLLAGDFVELGCHVPRYELGERCPTLVLTPRS